MKPHRKTSCRPRRRRHGRQIAAHLANAGVPVLLFDLPGPADKNAIARKALDGLEENCSRAAGLAGTAGPHRAGHYDEDHAGPGRVRPDHRGHRRATGLEARSIRPHRAPSRAGGGGFNTSGLSIAALAQALPAAACARFCGIHFFNPPRYMTLVEIVPTPDTDGAILDALETWLVSCLFRGVVRPRHPEFRRQPHRRLFHAGGHALIPSPAASVSTKSTP